MKVWVPIDLPEGWRVTSVVMRDLISMEFHGVTPVGPVRREEEFVVVQPEPQRERWEYRVVGPGPLSQTAAEAEQMVAPLGEEGWEAFAVAGAVWLKRRVL